MAGKGELGNQFGKHDIERLGLFSEMPYMNGKGYVSPFPRPTLVQGKNMMGDGPKIKAGEQDCYFDKEFKRLFQEKPFASAGNLKPISSPGDYYGTFQGHVEGFSNKRKPLPPYVKPGKNFVTSPGKKGNCGYLNICINPYPEHSVDRYGAKMKYKEYGKNLGGPLVSAHYTQDYFDKNPFVDPPKLKQGPTYVRPKETEKRFLAGNLVPNGPGKLLGGCKAGGFNKFPEYKPNKYITITDLTKPQRHVGGQFYPQSTAEKTLYTASVVNENIRFRFNERTKDNYEPNYVKYLLD